MRKNKRTQCNKITAQKSNRRDVTNQNSAHIRNYRTQKNNHIRVG